MTGAKRCGATRGISWLMFAGILVAGCASAETRAPLVLSLDLDKPEYRIGDTVVATVSVKNESSKAMNALALEHRAVTFLSGEKGGSARIRREPVFSAEVPPEPQQMAAGECLTRRFLFTRLTERAGQHALIADFKSAAASGGLMATTVFSAPAAFRVKDEVGVKRDPASGLILKAQAVELAKAGAGGEVTEARPVLAPLGQSGLYTWIVLMTVRMPDGTEHKKGVQVDPYHGKVRPLESRAPEAGNQQANQEEKEMQDAETAGR
jgi:hypothetical protein